MQDLSFFLFHINFQHRLSEETQWNIPSDKTFLVNNGKFSVMIVRQLYSTKACNDNYSGRSSDLLHFRMTFPSLQDSGNEYYPKILVELTAAGLFRICT